MENIFKGNSIRGHKQVKKKRRSRFARQKNHRCACPYLEGSLAAANINEEYIVKAVETKCHQMKDFLFTLGCYEGEKITVLSVISNQYVVVVKDARYSIDKCLASAIII